MVLYPMKGGIGKNHIELGSEVNLIEVLPEKPEIGAGMLPGLAEHAARGIQPDYQATRDKVSQLRRQAAVAATQIENVFVAPKVQLGYQPSPPLELMIGSRDVAGSIEFGRSSRRRLRQ